MTTLNKTDKMEKFLLKFFDLKKIPSKLFLVLWLSSFLILFVPKEFLTKLNLQEFLTEYGKYIGIIFIVSSGFLLVSIIGYISNLFTNSKLKRKYKRIIINEIKELDFHEKALLREFFINNKKTLQLPMDNDTVNGLANKHIIYQVSNAGFVYMYGTYFSYSISEFAMKNLTNDMIDLPKDPTEADKERVLNDRPNWAKEKSRLENLFNS